MRFAAFLLTLALTTAAWAGEEERYALAFDMKRTFFLNPDWGQEEEAVQGPYGDWDLGAQGYTIHSRDFETGHESVARTSVVNIIPDENGDLVVREGIRVPAEDGQGHRYFAAEDIHIPLGTDPHRAPNPLFGRHPMALVDEDYREVLGFPPLVSRMEGDRETLEEHMDNHWHYMVYRSIESGEVETVVLFDRNTGGVFLRASYGDWHEGPSGRMIPGRAVLRTFKGDQDRPVVEVRIANMEEVPLTEFEEPPAEPELPGDEEGPLIRYRPDSDEE